MRARATLLAALALSAPALGKPPPPRPAPPSPPPAAPASAVAPAPAPTPPPASSGAGESVGGCVESIPQGAQRPSLVESFPLRGQSGYAATLVVTVEHGKGESVLPRGLELQSEGDAARALKAAGFVIPDQAGPDAARLKVLPPDPKHPERVTTTLELPLLALPPEPGRHTLRLPPLPVAVSRANGDIATACTQAHTIVVEDPTAQTPDAAPKPNPDPRPQREEWTALRKALTYGAIGLALGAILAYLVRRWMQRPKAVPPPPPPRPPWEVALERLDEVRHAGLLEVGRFQEYFDRVNDAVRDYLGGRYGFEGLESTTDEILKALRRSAVDQIAMPGVVQFLDECDLVKFAKFTPTNEACTRALEAATRIVWTTMPRLAGGPPTPHDPVSSVEAPPRDDGPAPPPPGDSP